MRLAAKLILIFLVAVVLLTAANTYVAIEGQNASFEREQTEYAQRVGQSIESELLLTWDQQGDAAVDALLLGEHSSNQLVQIRFISLETEAPGEKQPVASPESLSHVARGQIVSVMVNGQEGAAWLHTYYPVISSDKGRAALEFSRPAGELQQQNRWAIYRAMATIVVLAIVGVGLVMYAGVTLVGRPLDRLIEKTQRIAAGDFADPLAIAGNGELSQLARALNDMCEQLTQHQETIRQESATRIATLEQLRHADRLKTVGRLAAGIAHELGTPLNVVAGRAGLIAAGKLSETETRESAKTIKAEANRITLIVRQLLDFARQSRPQRADENVSLLTDRTISLLQPLAEKKGVAITADDAERIVASIDSSQIQQVLTNIIMNAIQATPDGGQIAISIQRKTRRSPEQTEGDVADYVRIDVQDNGSGIDEQTREQLFEPFFTTKDVGEGTGLGLSIAFGIVQEHGGWIDVASQPGDGACFSIYLPIQPTAVETTHAR
ncbi:sensor histidine kinase [Blastopirellula marina]|uniref:histidine kinase n=1 Tax=Blastopirellula marina DSM 3645 TaxID=314230 RepID=A3ZYA9_9BACT|nr:sensor histidine kinase [Blastopirellula marina]EAQ78585.1 two-component system sensor histidine kinase-like protein (Ntr family protein) [Blastopirellula marina DSM 3645]